MELKEIARAFERRRDERLALATLVRATGSSYRRPGARMLISSGAEQLAGSLSAGCLEDEVAAAAPNVIATNKPQLLRFDTRRRFGCHGSIDIFVEPAALDFLQALAQLLETREPFHIVTNFESAPLGSRIAINPSGDFIQRVDPLIRLLIIGHGPDAAALRAQAELLGWETFVTESIVDWEGEMDARTAVVIATHNYGRDCAALRHLLPRGLPYLGVIGPRKRRDELLLDAIDAGAEPKSNLFAPAGLDLGAETPAEIALSIVSQIQHVLADGTGEALRDSKLPIHHARTPSLNEGSGNHSGSRRVVASR